MRAARAGAVVLGAFVTWSCAGSDAPPVEGPEAPAPAAAARGTWVGQLDGRDAFVAVVAGEAQVVAYVCEDGALGTWFFGPAGDGTVELQAPSGARLELALGDPVSGRVLLDDVAWAFTAARTDEEVLFRADALAGEKPVVAGWIRLGARTQGTLSLSGALEPAPTLASTISLDLDGAAIVLSPAPMSPSTLGTPVANTTKFAWAATGDSYGSGEGNPERGINDPQAVDDFSGLRWSDDATTWIPLTGTTLAAESFSCHRSDQAGAPKANRSLRALYPGLQFALGFLACSGAETKHLVDTEYGGPTLRPEAMVGYARPPQPPQLQRVGTFRTAQGRLDALFVSAGGNDLGFGQIITDCISPDLPFADCSAKWEPLLEEKLAALARNYDALETAIVGRFGANLPVLISHYPNPLSSDSRYADPPVCIGHDYEAHAEVGVGGFDDMLQDNVTAQEALWAYTVPRQLNAAVSSAALRHGWTVVNSHTGAFDGHGVCAATPLVNLNSHGLRRQGHDVPDTLFFVFSSGFMHPNNAGYAAYGNAIVERLRPLVDLRARSGLTVPTGLRVGAAVNRGALTLHWNDRSTAENAYEVEVLPARAVDAPYLAPPPGAIVLASGFLARVPGVGAQQFTHAASGPGQFLYRVRACQTGISAGARCGAFSAQLLGTNVAPAPLENVRVATRTLTVNGALRLETVLTWDAQPGALEYVARFERLDGSEAPGERRTPSTSVSAPTLQSLYRYRAAACNRVGCSLYRDAP